MSTPKVLKSTTCISFTRILWSEAKIRDSICCSSRSIIPLIVYNLLFHPFRNFSPLVALVSKLRLKSGLPNGILNRLRCKSMGCSCSRNNILFDHDRTEIVSACMQTKLPGLFSDGQPGSLDIFNIWKHNPAKCNHAHIFLAGYGIGYSPYFFKQRPIVHKRPGDKGDKAISISRFFCLNLSYPNQVFKPFLYGLDM